MRLGERQSSNLAYHFESWGGMGRAALRFSPDGTLPRRLTTDDMADVSLVSAGLTYVKYERRNNAASSARAHLAACSQ